MSPEQAKGLDVDRRTDIFAFGCVLYEMLTGKFAFHGDTTTDTLAAVIRGEPDWSLLPAETPPALRALLRRCLQKEARQRLRDIGDARIALEDFAAGKSVDVVGAGPAPTVSDIAHPAPNIASRSRWWIPAIALLVIAVVVVEITLRPGTPNTNGPLQHLQIAPPPGGRFVVGASVIIGGMAVSPNGEMLAAVAIVDGAPSLWVESLRDGSARNVASSRSYYAIQRPFWSPDSKFIGFFAVGGLAARGRNRLS
jgi:serine/threonine protein kinase